VGSADRSLPEDLERRWSGQVGGLVPQLCPLPCSRGRGHQGMYCMVPVTTIGLIRIPTQMVPVRTRALPLTEYRKDFWEI
jgi:hypothetical protein